MYKKFFANENLMTLLDWLLNHSSSEYSADNIQMFTKIYNPEEFIRLLHLLYTLDICDVVVDNDVEALFVSLNNDSELTKAFMTIRDGLELKSFETSEVSSVLNEEEPYDIESLIFEVINDPSFDIKKVIDQCKDYESLLDEGEDEELNEVNKQMYDRIKELDNDGELDEFLEFLENIQEMKENRNLYI